MTKRQDIKKLHLDAMALSQKAKLAIGDGETEAALLLYSKAFELEQSAALEMFNSGKEPTTSVLFRSAAVLAKNCNRFLEAEKMIGYGLAGNPPAEIAEELRNLFEEINFFRHLSIKGLELDSNEFLLSFTGNSVSYGMIHSREFLNRVQIIEQLTYRTVERIGHKPYRTNGAVSQNVKQYFEPYYSVPIAASYAIIIRLTKPTQQVSMWENVRPKEVIDEILFGLEKIAENNTEDLKTHIADETYFQNFVSLAKGLAPDGDRIKQVGLLAVQNGKEKTVALQKQSKEISVTEKYTKPPDKIPNTITGVLTMADANRNKIKLITTQEEKNYLIKVPQGLKDIVKIYFDETVTITVKGATEKSLEMVEIL